MNLKQRSDAAFETILLVLTIQPHQIPIELLTIANSAFENGKNQIRQESHRKKIESGFTFSRIRNLITKTNTTRLRNSTFSVCFCLLFFLVKRYMIKLQTIY